MEVQKFHNQDVPKNFQLLGNWGLKWSIMAKLVCKFHQLL